MKQIGMTLALVSALLLVAPGTASAIAPDTRPHWCLVLVDLIFVRPPSLITPIGAVALTAVAYPLVLPFSVDGANQMAEDMVVGAWNFTFVRPLGDFSD